MLRLIGICAFVLLGACAPRGQLLFMPEAKGVGEVQKVFVATTRADDGEGDYWSAQRTYMPRYARFDVSIPPEREPGTLPWPPKNGVADPRKHMVTVNRDLYPGSAAFRRALAKEMSVSQRGTREAVIFVHGFNNTFAEGLYRFAQLYHDLEMPGVAVHYSWPSRGSVLAYAYDRDSTLFARDGLETLLQDVASAGADRILIVAHSMGSALTMETLRLVGQNRQIRSRLAGVVLMSPDLDVDVFKSQAARIGALPQPFVVMTSRRDNALALSATIARESARLGNLRDPAVLAGLNVTLVETGAYSDGDSHFTAATSPALISILRRAGDIDQALGQDARSRVGLLPGAVLRVQGVTQMVLTPGSRWGE
ncbi:alpha/beta hydrolase [Falsigemmobacter faecalis]|uniref:Alpha/beta fold hydrolase n=1 Tax=Falsigemmobacter faecalis TaxID=2488730 RepID=A0A3P3DV76_9RHOB|nr:alpha/beta fold hydrolase [Falsigemmobacter faecalis]RRH77884.1 alpha/beta fold hydrolase [Falsigemmobacter faecalis]